MSGPVDPLWSELAGHNLIEASAGTGKTFTIAGLYLRLVLEAEQPVERILVVTFTEAATEELRERIRSRLEEARRAVLAGSAEEAFLQRLIVRQPDPARAERLLRRAVQSFDQAAIYTIHGFCQRILAEHAFEGRRPFEMELLTEPDALIQEVMDDFWRRKTAALERPFLAYLLGSDMGPERLNRDLRPFLAKPDVVVRATEANREADYEAYADAYIRARQIWGKERETIHKRLLDGLPGYKGNQYDEAKIAHWMNQMGTHLAGECPPLSWFDHYRKLSASGLRNGTKKAFDPPEHGFFDVMDELAEAWEAVEEHFKARKWDLIREALEYAWTELPQRQKAQRVQTFDELLLNLDRALDGAGGEALAEALRERLPVALIDEFQDTDPVQYRIVRRIYGGAPGPVFLVGDPKQAIYGFRGADVFAYLRARSDTEKAEDGTIYPLPKNRRSTAKLVTAFNTLFEGNRPFWFDAIPYYSVESVHPKATLTLPDFDPAPFQWRFLPLSESDDKNKKKELAAAEAINETADEIARLLTAGAEGRARLTHPEHLTRPLKGQDIAVLVRKHEQAQAVRRALSRRGIPSMEQARESVFATTEAEELERVLAAAQDPRRDDRIRAALATTLYGYTAYALYTLAQDEQAWDRTADRFQALHDRWQVEGFMGLFQSWLAQEGIRARLLARADGERRLTNLLHLAELLHRQAQEANLGMEGVLAWLGRRRQATNLPANNEEQLRLESEGSLVQLITIHKAKGLEYPVVFCPFLWDLRGRSPTKNEAVPFHDPANGNRLTLELGTEEREAAKARKQEEDLAENLRLLYVVVTRAIHRLYVLTGPINELEQSALGYLIHTSADPGDDWEALKKGIPKNDPVALRRHLEAFQNAHPDVFALADASQARDLVEPIPGQETEFRELNARAFPGKLATDRFVTSFSGLMEGQPQDRPEADRGERDPPEASSVAEAPLDAMARFPRGPAAGTCLHAVLETVDFTAPTTDWSDPVARTLREHGFDAEQWQKLIIDMLGHTLTTPLGGMLGPRCLGEIDRRCRLDEMAFYYPIARLTDSALNRVLADHGYYPGSVSPDAGPALSFRPQEGYLRGFIDLVFEAEGRYYLADYKSNWLGPDASAYTDSALGTAIAEHGYALQYLLYSLALHRHLQVTLPGYRYRAHFGGAYYLFLRGMNPERGEGAGVHFDWPEPALIEALDDLFRRGA